MAPSVVARRASSSHRIRFVALLTLLTYLVVADGFAYSKEDPELNVSPHMNVELFPEEFGTDKIPLLHHFERKFHFPHENQESSNFNWLANLCKIVEAIPVKSVSSMLLKTKKYSDYHWVPHDFQSFSKEINNMTNCSIIHSSLYENFLPMDDRRKPVWLHRSPKIGACPAQFILRDLGEGRIPREVLEAKCSCEGETCSKDGYECLPISRMVTVWVFQQGVFRPDLEEINFACACIKRPGDFGDTFESPAVLS